MNMTLWAQLRSAFKTLVASVLFFGVVLFLCETGRAASGVTGVPFNPTYGAINAQTLSLTSAASVTTVNAAMAVNIGTTNMRLSSSGTTSTFNVFGTNDMQLKAQNGCIELNAIQNTILEPCAGSIGSPIRSEVFTAQSASAVTSGHFYAANVQDAGSACVDSGVNLPSGWSVARTAVGVCTITFPTVTSATKIFVTVTAIPVVTNAEDVCTVPTVTTTTAVVHCFNATPGAADVSFYVMIQDWN
ncbi:MAG TPA: hypothetical protein VGN70_04410 [Gammaproteobacteria bacterium]|jgi:hypothetical protein